MALYLRSVMGLHAMHRDNLTFIYSYIGCATIIAQSNNRDDTDSDVNFVRYILIEM